MLKFNQSLWKLIFAAFTFSIITTNYIYADGKVIAKVNDVVINEDALTTEVNKKLPLASYHARISKEKLLEFRNQALQHLIEKELLYQEAKRQKLTVDLFEVEQQISLMKSGYPSEKAFQQELAKTGLNNSSLMAHLERQLLIQRIGQKEITEKVTVTDADLREYYEANKSKFIKPEQFQLRHILISVKPGAMAVGWNAGLEKGQQIYSRLSEGEDFTQIAREVSADSSSRDNGGDIGWFHKGQLIPELEEALSGMQIGDSSEPVRSIYGFHIIKLEGRQPQLQLTFDQINLHDLKNKLEKKRIAARRQEIITKLKAKSEIQIFEL